jgi:hypothetical protein
MMKDKFFVWFGRNRRTIGYTIGGFNLLIALSHLIQAQYGLALLWVVIGATIVFDAWEYK